MMDKLELTLNSPLTEEQMDAITDVDFDNTSRIWFNTKHGKTVEFIKRKHGKWIINGNDAMCSNCNDIFCGDWADVDLIADCDMNFCPNCGAQMESGDSDV